MLHMGATIAYAESVEQVPANMAEVRPTVMCSVPRLYEKMYARVLEKVAARPARCARRSSAGRVGVGREAFRHRVDGTDARPACCAASTRSPTSSCSPRSRTRTGGRLRFFVSGGAPLAREIAEFFGAAGS